MSITVVRTDQRPHGEVLLTMGEPVVPTPEEWAAHVQMMAEFERNRAVFEEQVDDIYARYRGQFVTVAGGEVFVGPDHREVEARATIAHPDSKGRQFHRYIRTESGPVI